MKNKSRFWRRISKKRYDGKTEIRMGRHLKEKMCGMQHQKLLLPIHRWLFRSAGIGQTVQVGRNLTVQWQVMQYPLSNRTLPFRHTGMLAIPRHLLYFRAVVQTQSLE